MRRLAKIPRWVGWVAAVVIVLGLGWIGASIGGNTGSIGQLERVKARQERDFTRGVVAACQAVQHTNQAFDALIAVVNTGTRAGQPIVEQLVASVAAVERDTRLCDLAARRVGHPIRPFPLSSLPDNR